MVAEHLHAVYGFGTVVGDGLEERSLCGRVVEVVEDYRLSIGNREREGATRRSGIYYERGLGCEGCRLGVAELPFLRVTAYEERLESLLP